MPQVLAFDPKLMTLLRLPFSHHLEEYLLGKVKMCPTGMVSGISYSPFPHKMHFLMTYPNHCFL